MHHVVIFDFDGTIANTIDLLIRLFNEIAPKYNLQNIKDSEKETLRNSSATELIKIYKISPWKLIGLVKDLRSKLKLDIQNVAITNGLKDVFEKLGKHDVELGIVTSNSRENVQLFLKKWNINSINFIHTENNLFGKARVLNNLIKKQGLKKKEVIYVGDEVRDIEAAQKVGIKIIAVTWGFNSEKRLKKAKPTYLISEPKEIIVKLALDDI